MARRNRRSLFPSSHALSRVLQAAIGGILVVGLLTRNLSVVVNATLAFGATFLPAVLRRDYRINLGPWVTLWITAALFLHTVGMLGFYDDFWWYDHVTHTLSATIVATVGYVSARAVDRWSEAIHLPSRFLFVFVLLFTLALGVLWEAAEFGARIGADALGLDPVLVQYGLDDTLVDLLFDAVGAVLVAAFVTERVGGLVDSLANSLADRLGEYGDHSDADGRNSDPSPGSGPAGRPSGDRAPFAQFVDDDPGNVWRSWLLVGFLAVVVIGGVAVGAVLASLLVGVVLVLAVVPAVAYRSAHAMLPWPLLAVASLPVFGAAFGSPWLTSNLVTYAAVATVALVVVVELHLFTETKATPRFAVLLVVVTTMAAAGIWAVGRWLVDLYLGTTFVLVPGASEAAIETALMWEFVHASVAGLLAGVVFELGFRRRTP